MSISCVTAAPTHHPPGEAHSLLAPASLVTKFAAGPLPVNRASEVAARRLAALNTGTRRPPSPLLSLSATPQLQLAQPLSNCVAKNAFGDTIRHATESPQLDAGPLPISPTFSTAHRSRSVAASATLPKEHLWEASPTPISSTTTGRSGSTTPLRGRRPLPQIFWAKPVSAICRPTYHSERPPLKQLANCVAENASRDRNHLRARHDQSQATTIEPCAENEPDRLAES
ncbi:hypothetical protein PLANPX_2202 [Lacipirellula parvula]|uniref:Uncharacterized protein n=1 Tax=Lacipirellula parvula TaxID=2650471 RepID=A0A5K7X7K1_9BACT|nr:hypothetical protein PLANPX_2202 [Lacipirellula parvula]